jgi:hypothetical protein
MDVVADENGKPVLDEDGSYIKTGFKIKKVVVTRNGKRIVKDEFYDAAIDVEGAPYIYEETDIPVERVVEE